ncbi:MAG: hypothetical protein HC831_07430 [Chloroflexia bacterium]|nr:hypothetical protein [Chloroflexia bacterium]
MKTLISNSLIKSITICVLALFVSITELVAQNQETNLYFYRPAKAFSSGLIFELLLNDISIGKLTNNSNLSVNLKSGGKLQIKLLGFFSTTRDADNDISRTMYVDGGKDYYFALMYDEIWMLRDIDKYNAIAEFNKCKKKETFEATSNQPIVIPIITDAKNIGFQKITDEIPPQIIFDKNELNASGKITSTEKEFLLTGKVTDDNKILGFTLNNRAFNLNGEKFVIKLSLNNGVNNLSVKAVDESDNAVSKIIQIIYNETVVVNEKPIQPTNGSALSNIEWLFPPQENTQVGRDKMNIEVCIKPNKSIQRIDLVVNDSHENSFYNENKNNGSECDMSIRENIKLSFGNNIINLRCQTTDGQVESKRYVTFKPAPANYHALIIGVEEYDDETINDLSNPVKDAKTYIIYLQQNIPFLKKM